MRKKIFATSILLTMTLSALCQTKLDLNLYSLSKKPVTSLSKGTIKGNEVKYITVLGTLKDNALLSQSELDNLGIIVDHNSYGIVRMRVPVYSITALDSLDSFRSFEMPKTMQVMNKIAHEQEHVVELQDEVKSQAEGLPRTYTGEGVIVGVFDQGIDYNHVNFRDPVTHKTRIKKAMPIRNFSEQDNNIYDSKGNRATPEEVIEIYTNENDIDTLTTDCNSESHGTHTSGIAAGSYNGDMVNKDNNVCYTGYRGTAYKADLILGSSTSLRDDFIQLELEEMDEYATKNNQPLVVNLSIGMIGNWLDGKLSNNIFFNNFTNGGDRPGRIICISSCNSGMNKSSIYKSLNLLNGYTLKTLLAPKDTTNNLVAYSDSIKFYCSDNTQLEVSLLEVDLNSGSVYKTYSNDDLKKDGVLTTSFSGNHDSRFYGTLSVNKQGIELGRALALKINSRLGKPCKVRMFQESLDEGSEMDFTAGGLFGYTEGDATSCINTLTTNEAVLCIGAWNGNDQWNPYLQPDTIVSSRYSSDVFCKGNIAQFSSWCVEDDNGKSYPDFCAPGMGIISGYNAYDTTNFGDNGTVLPKEKNIDWKYVVGKAVEEYGRQDGRSSMFGEMQGTSMSCPNAVGVIALWLQANPELTVNQIREVIKQTADHDDYTDGNYKTRFGAGKLNAMEGLKYILKNYPTAIHEVVNGEPKGLDKPTTYKKLKNGHIIIIKDNKEYNTAGQQVD